MSWDVILMNVPPEITSANELGPDYGLLELGSRAEVVSILTQSCPQADFSDPTWGNLQTANFSIEFSIGKDDPVNTIMLYVRGSDRVIRIIEQICEDTGWRAFDSVMGDFINFSKQHTVGFDKWRKYRDQLIGGER